MKLQLKQIATLFFLVSPATQAQQPTIPSPQVHAIVIGINQYEDPKIPSLRTAVRDSVAVGNWFVRIGGWKPGQVLLLNDNGDALPGEVEFEGGRTIQPSRANLNWAFSKWLDARAKPGDRIVVYYAGQAIGRAARRKEAAGKTYLLPADANLTDLDGTAIVLDEVLQPVVSRGVNPTLVWLDTSTRGRGPGLPAVKGMPDGDDWLRTLARWPGVSAWLAADGAVAPDGEGLSPFVRGLAASLGSPDKTPRTLLGALAEMHRSGDLSKQGFRTLGGVDPSWSIWSSGVRVATPPTPELVFQRGHADRVTAVHATADGDRIVSASEDSTIRIWRSSDGALLRVLTAPLAGVSVMAMSPDGRTIAFGDGAGRVQGWDLVEDRPLRRPGPPFHSEPITGLAFLPGGTRFVTVDREGKSGLWDIQSPRLDAHPLTAKSLGRIASSSEASPAALAATTLDGEVLLFDGDGKALRTLEGPGGFLSALDLSADGKSVAVGNDAGVVRSWDAANGRVRRSGPLATDNPSEIKALRSSQGLWFAADGSRAWSFDDATTHPMAAPGGQPWTGQAERIAASVDGGWTAIATKDGVIGLWAVDGARTTPVALNRGQGETLALGFSPEARMLISGDGDGGIRRWNLGRQGGAPSAAPAPRIEPGRGKVATLAASRSGKYLLQVTKDGEAIVWDILDGRQPHRIPGNWSTGAFLASDDHLALLSHPDEGGDVVIVNREDGARLSRTFARPKTGEGQESKVAFGTVVVSPGGRYLAAASIDAQAPLACVWEADTGKLVHFTRSHEGGLTSVDVSGGDAFVLTGSLDGTVRIWAVGDAEANWTRPVAELKHDREGADPAVTAARFSPANPHKVVTGTRGGWIRHWTWGKEKPSGRDLTKLDGSVNAVAFSADGRWLSGSGMLDKSARLWQFADPSNGPPRPSPLQPLPHHVEQVTTLAFVPGGKILATGSDDATVRFWDLSARNLLGTVAATPKRSRARGKDMVSPTSLDWLACTPSGLFDGSDRGESLVRWRVGSELQAVEQYQDTHFRFGLVNGLALAQTPEPPRLEGRNARRIAIVAPREESSTKAREIDLTIALDTPETTGLRLYQDGVPIQAETDFAAGENPTRVVSTVKLRSGENRFYALASRPGAIDGRSNDVVIRYEGPEPPGRLHVLAVGISAYERRRLKYAHEDATSLAAFLHQRGITASGEPGKLLVRTDADATEANINRDFQALREAVKGRPEDTVVVFLAGHTDVFRDQFYLLLPGFPFPDAPKAELVALRGELNPSGYIPKVEDPNVLSYVRIYNRLSRLDALQRLVIVDACQAGAILSDPAVRRVQSLLEGGAKKARNAYLLASRRGEAATEADALSHGLMTYVLLRGLGQGGLKAIPDDADIFGRVASADLDGDGMVTTEELRRFADRALPRLSARFPDLVRRAGGEIKGAEQGVRTEGAEESFALIPIPR